MRKAFLVVDMHMIIVKNKKCSVTNIIKEHPDAVIIDVTSKALSHASLIKNYILGNI